MQSGRSGPPAASRQFPPREFMEERGEALELASERAKAPPIICSRQQFEILPLFKCNKLGMIFHENRLLADDSHEISYLNLVEN